MAKRSLRQIIENVEAYQKIQNLMGRYQYLHTAAMYDDMANLFALKTPGVSAEMAWGVYDGAKGIKRLFGPTHRVAEGADSHPGHMFILPLTTPVIEVAGDGKTAKGVWIATGTGTSPNTFSAKAELQARWEWCKYGCDFIKENGQWKIWHMHVYGIFMTPYDRTWIEKADHLPVDLPDELKADRPPTRPLWMYKPTIKTELAPVPPEPYEIWDDSMSYVPF